MNEHDHETGAVAAVIKAADRLQNDAEGFAALLADDATIVNVVGIRVTGREAIEQTMRQALTTSLSQIRTRTELIEVRFPAPGVAIANCVKHIHDEREDSSTAPAQRGALTFALVKRENDWRIALIQTTPIAE